jgi:hypothetical protein
MDILTLIYLLPGTCARGIARPFPSVIPSSPPLSISMALLWESSMNFRGLPHFFHAFFGDPWCLYHGPFFRCPRKVDCVFGKIMGRPTQGGLQIGQKKNGRTPNRSLRVVKKWRTS